ncbi:A24 family peptidase [Sporomusa sp. KB1]|jgi:leader peptidase (prepilin peptidase)/N-methyltransferase|uniref:prepilin peptidase n=1 Tax=Sporomusa sp. KB1 TaxID=943346 RepID=UPI0011A9F79B|nr:A24 family peptidase [Sporomusa sp. KB1]TWH48299.1 type 4 prepilin peptidase 1 [Sporomusa sp. KB1]
MFDFMILVIGIIIGSFLTVCIYRLPQNQSIVTLPSHCLHCNTKLKAGDLIPILSYLLLRGKCRYCGKPYSSRYAVVELITGLLFLWCYQIVGWSPDLLKVLIFTAFLIVITFIDYDHQLILDKVLLWFAGVGVAINLGNGYPHISDMVIAALAGGGLLLFVAVLTRGGMGGGDIKFVAALGLWLGVKLVLVTLLLAFIIGGIGSALLLIFKVKGRKDFIPFGPFLAIGALSSILYGSKLVWWYLQTIAK